MSSKSNYYHNKGQQDASKGKYEAPHGAGEMFTRAWFDPKSTFDRCVEENKQYDEGQRNNKK